MVYPKSSSLRHCTWSSGFFALGLALSFVLIPSTFAKVKPGIIRPKEAEITFVQKLSGAASIKLDRELNLQKSENEVMFQDGKLVEQIELYKTPHCYLHFKKGLTLSPGSTAKSLPGGAALQVSKIDNVYFRGSTHVVFWFDSDKQSVFSDLTCVSHYRHTLTVAEIKAALGSEFEINIPYHIEMKALVNTVPSRHATVLQENSPTHQSVSATRAVLSGS